MENKHAECDREIEVLLSRLDKYKLALKEAINTIHLEFCSSDGCHSKCKSPINILGDYELATESEWMESTK